MKLEMSSSELRRAFRVSLFLFFLSLFSFSLKLVSFYFNNLFEISLFPTTTFLKVMILIHDFYLTTYKCFGIVM